ncbi:hypothetical protein FSP39_018832 [Pinctada imbricata]|uniref:Uncharacterized protein n=1 Tax=Pinctada imbricata TaxID=66713 RepID=A0AA89C700_PINIB|nr:hypothetical protein FSP39_018832 [Pinctada imbricata]
MNYHKVYMNQIASSSLMGQVSQLWRNQLLCDAVIKTGNVDTKAHRLVLVAACPMLQHMENATVGANLEVRLASSIKQESVTAFLQYLYEGFMMLTDDNYKDVEKIGKLLQVESVIKCCIDFEKCLTQKTGMPESVNTRYAMKENEESIHVRTTDLLKVQDSEKRSLSGSNYSTPESKRLKTMPTPPPPLLLPMLNLAQHNNDKVSMRKDYLHEAGSADLANVSQIPQISPQIITHSTKPMDTGQDGIEIIHREAPDPNLPMSQSSQAIQQAMGISVASQKSENLIPQVVNIADNLPPKRSSISSVLSSPQLNVPSTESVSASNLTVPTGQPLQERRVSTGSMPTDNIPKTVDWAQNKTIESRRQFLHPSPGQFIPPPPENFHQKLTEFYATHLQQQRQVLRMPLAVSQSQSEDTIPYCQNFPTSLPPSPRHSLTAQSSSPVATSSGIDLASIKTEDPGDTELKIDIPDPGGQQDDQGLGRLEEPLDDGSSTGSDHGGALWADNSQRAHAVHDVYHLWEFIRDLLHDPKYCPRIIKWENAEDGVFRVVDSQEVASLWGKTKKSTKMTYEYMSRSLRYCRTLGYFADLPKNAGYPKKLCFKFGPKAHSWKPKDSPKLDEPMNLVTRKGDSISEVW